MDAQDARIAAVLSGCEDATFEECVTKFYEHLKTSLQLPCDVTGSEDFPWEEFYVLGPGDPAEYERLKKDQPSFEDVFELIAIVPDAYSEWMISVGDDLGAQVRRKSDDQEFLLGLSDLVAVDKKSNNYQLINDYAVWFVNAQ